MSLCKPKAQQKPGNLLLQRIWARGRGGPAGAARDRPDHAVAFAAAAGPPPPERQQQAEGRRRAPSRPLPCQGGPPPPAGRPHHRLRSRSGLQPAQPPP